MTLQILLVLVLFIGFGLIAFLYYILVKTSQREDATRAWIFIDNGNQISKPCKAKRTHISNAGMKYKYRYQGKMKEVFVSTKYPIKYHKSKRILFVDSNCSLIALPFGNTPELSSSEREDLIYNLTSSHLITQAIQAMQGKALSGIVIIAIILALLVGGVGVYFLSHKSITPVSSNVTQTQQQNDTIKGGAIK